jgi:two-component system sensor histidine kinase MprB
VRGAFTAVRRLPIKARLTLLTTTAVAVAIAGTMVVAWLLVRHELRGQLDQSLRQEANGALHATHAGHPGHALFQQLASGAKPPPGPRGAPPGPREFGMQVIGATGSTTGWSQYPAVLTAADRRIAASPVADVRGWRDGRSTSGAPLRVLTVSLGGGRALVLTKPLTSTDNTLSDLTLLLLVVSAIGIAGAAGAGLLVARAGLRPVDRLTGAVEHVARTKDLSTRIPVGGRDEIARLSASFNAMTAALASSRELQQQLVADAGHELRTPLTSLRTNIDLLLRSETSGRALPAPRRLALLGSVKEQLVELSGLMTDLLELSRPDGGVAANRPTTRVALHDCVRRAVGRARLRGAGVRIESDLMPWYVVGDADALERAVVNLLDNAIKFSPQPGSSRTDGDGDSDSDSGGGDSDSGARDGAGSGDDADDAVVRVRLVRGTLTVRDHGPGITSDDLPHVFDRFWRAPAARSLPGTGLGLAIVARVVADTGGTVQLRPAQGGGTLATVRLPGSMNPHDRFMADSSSAHLPRPGWGGDHFSRNTHAHAESAE